jgi:23S rRNA (adenine2503-C2)-methyltransferase
MNNSTKNLLGMDVCELEEIMVSLGQKPFRARQIYSAIYRRKEFDVEHMTDLAKSFRQRLSNEYGITPPQIERAFVSSDGTKRYLLALDDGQNIESVYIPEPRRRTICISTQVGCAVGCTFCMTAKLGLRRHLTAGEIVGQILVVLKDVGEEYLGSKRVNIVLMGMGEPLHNYDNTVKAVALMADPSGLSISPRRITLSTSGVVPAIKKLVQEKVVPNLAISLNATFDEQRTELMPINKKWSIEELLDTCRTLVLPPGRRITFEYVLIAGINDSLDDAWRLVKLLRGLRPKVNLIPLNWDPALENMHTPAWEHILAFQKTLTDNYFTAMIRRPRGLDVAAACGQLAARHAQK